ncbi:MAG: DoxX family membrane protein [Caulobacterales bacterium]|nr:DoxX family membrane protein [Caulobacterales bacterium]
MAAEGPTRAFGWRVYGLGVMAIAVLCLVRGDFDPGQPVPKAFPARAALAYVAGAYMLIAAGVLQWRRTVAWGAAALTAYYTLVVVILMGGRSILRHASEYLAYSNTAGQVAIAAGGLIVFASHAAIDAPLAGRLTWVGQKVFGLCALLFGGAHFLYMNLTAPLVPSWLPPSQVFWGYATGVAHLAAGLAILSGVQARLAAILLTIMFASFTPLVHLPMLIADPSNQGVWTENAANLAYTGVAWVVADSLARSRRQKPAA